VNTSLNEFKNYFEVLLKMASFGSVLLTLIFLVLHPFATYDNAFYATHTSDQIHLGTVT